MAITAAMVVLGYFELPDDEQPKQSIWHDPQRLEEWFDAVKQRRETGHQPIEADDADMTGNTLTRELIGDT